MLNLFAILISLAMLLTGAPEGTLSEPVGKTLVIDNIAVDRDGENLALTPTAHLATRTDGATAAYDFYIESGGEKLMPLQLTVDEDKLLLADPTGATLKLTKEDLGGMAGEGLEVAGSVNAALSSFREMIRMFGSSEKLIATQARADALYETLVDRGAGTSEKMMFQGETLEVTTYEYDLDAAALSALADRLYAEDEALSRYGQMYLAMVKQTEGFEDVDSFTAVYERLNTKLHVVESVSVDGRSIQDSVLTLNAPGIEKSLQFDIYTVKDADSRSSTVSAEIELNGLALEIYADSVTQGANLQLSLTLTANQGGAGSSEEPTEDVADGDSFEGESDEEDLFYATLDLNIAPQEQTTFDFNVDLAGGDSFGFNLDRASDTQVTGITLTRGDRDSTLNVSFDVHESDGLFDLRTSEDGAVSAAGPDLAALLGALNGDVAKLTADENVRKAIGWISEFGALPSGLPDQEGPAAGSDQPSAPAGDSPDFTNPEFTYLPEGYAVTDTIVDAGNGFVSLTVSNGQGGNIYISLGESLTASSGKTYRYYAITPEAENPYSPVTGLLVTAEDTGDYVIYNADDGSISYSVFPDGASLPVEEILRLIGGIQFN